jgi:hypothetical protein
MTDRPRCNGRCRPKLALYNAACPLHGLPLWRLVVDIEASNAAERRRGPGGPADAVFAT